MVKTITTEEVKENLENNKDFLLFDALMKNGFEARYIPGAKSVPYSPTFLEDFEKATNVSKDANIAVYCASSGCQLSVMASDVFEKAGYTNISHFEVARI